MGAHDMGRMRSHYLVGGGQNKSAMDVKGPLRSQNLWEVENTLARWRDQRCLESGPSNPLVTFVRLHWAQAAAAAGYDA